MMEKCWQTRWSRITEVMRSVTVGIFRHLRHGGKVGRNEVQAMAAVLLCYSCRRRISPEELAQGLHNHREHEPQTATAQLASSDVIRPEIRTEQEPSLAAHGPDA